MNIKLNTKKFGEIIYQIDEEDFHLIENHKMYACKLYKNHLYIIRDDKQWLHKLIMPHCPKGFVIDHINLDTLDNRKQNLRIASRKLNRQNTNTNTLKEEEILQILCSPLSNNNLAIKFNCSNCLISKIRTGELYNNLFPEILRYPNKKQKQNLYSPVRE